MSTVMGLCPQCLTEEMKACRWKSPLLMVSGLVVLIVGLVAAWLFQEVGYLRIDSPDGMYRALVTYRRFESFRPTYPGQSGDKAGYITIVDKDGGNYGRVAVPMVWMSRDLEWTKGGADLKLICKWDFAKREYRFWNESQTEEIVRHAR